MLWSTLFSSFICSPFSRYFYILINFYSPLFLEHSIFIPDDILIKFYINCHSIASPLYLLIFTEHLLNSITPPIFVDLPPPTAMFYICLSNIYSPMGLADGTLNFLRNIPFSLSIHVTLNREERPGSHNDYFKGGHMTQSESMRLKPRTLSTV